MGFLTALKHRTASAQSLGACWEFTPFRGLEGPTVMIRLVVGRSAPRDIDVPVCSLAKRRAGAWILTHHRGSREVWLLTENQVQRDVDEQPVATPFAPGLAHGSIELLGCPDDVATELEQL